MKTELINIGPGTDIDLVDLIQSRLLIQGNSGSGKSSFARLIIEQAFGKIPFVIWDIEGEYYTLKELSGDIIVIGGQHADVPLTMELAEKLPGVIVKNKLNVIVDLSDLKMRGRIEFTKLFFETLMDLPIQYWMAYLFFLEECHKLAGEQDKQESATAIKDLMQRGRKRGYCGIPITQRISMLNKSVAAECNNKFIGKTVLDNDMDRSARELGFSKAADRLVLRDLKKGEFFAYGTSITPDHVHKISVFRPKTTIVKVGVNIDFKPERPTAALLEMLTKLSETPQEEKVVDSDGDMTAVNNELQARSNYIFELQNEIESLKKDKDTLLGLAFKRGEIIDSIRNSQIMGVLVAGRDEVQRLFERIDQTEDHVQGAIDIAEQSRKYMPKVVSTGPDEEFISRAAARGINLGNYQNQKNSDGTLSALTMSRGERAILIACAQYGGGLERKQLSILAGYKQSARDTFISRLKQRGYVNLQGTKVVATDKGKKALGSDYQPLPTGKKLQEYWNNRLTGGEKAIFMVIVYAYPRSVSRELLAQKTNYKQSARDTFISRLAGRELLTIPEKGYVKAADLLFS